MERGRRTRELIPKGSQRNSPRFPIVGKERRRRPDRRINEVQKDDRRIAQAARRFPFVRNGRTGTGTLFVLFQLLTPNSWILFPIISRGIPMAQKMLKRLDAVQGMAVLDATSGARIGEVADMIVNPSSGVVQGMI